MHQYGEFNLACRWEMCD